MRTISLATWNAEWMNSWFGSDDRAPAFRRTFIQDGQLNHTAETAERAAALIRALDVDVLALQEAPSRAEELELFVREYLSEGGRAQYRVIVGGTGGAQRLAVLYRPDKVDSAGVAARAMQSLGAPWPADIEGRGRPVPYHFTRVPLLVDLAVSGTLLRLAVLHTKSSFVNNGAALWESKQGRARYVREALRARRRNAFECLRMRGWLEELLGAEPSARVAVVGDLNDGPGQDLFEEVYLAHNTIDVLLGSSAGGDRLMFQVASEIPQSERYTAVFDDFVTGERERRLLLDHILLSPALASARSGLRRVRGTARIAHETYEALVAAGPLREERPADHRPVAVTLTY